VSVPADLECVDSLLELRGRIDTMLEIPGDLLELECSGLEWIPGPVVGWLSQLRLELLSKGQTLRCTEASSELILALRTIDPELTRSLVAPRPHLVCSRERPRKKNRGEGGGR
jgi:hypothetical protein